MVDRTRTKVHSFTNQKLSSLLQEAIYVTTFTLVGQELSF